VIIFLKSFTISKEILQFHIMAFSFGDNYAIKVQKRPDMLLKNFLQYQKLNLAMVEIRSFFLEVSQAFIRWGML